MHHISEGCFKMTTKLQRPLRFSFLRLEQIHNRVAPCRAATRPIAHHQTARKGPAGSPLAPRLAPRLVLDTMRHRPHLGAHFSAGQKYHSRSPFQKAMALWVFLGSSQQARTRCRKRAEQKEQKSCLRDTDRPSGMSRHLPGPPAKARFHSRGACSSAMPRRYEHLRTQAMVGTVP